MLLVFGGAKPDGDTHSPFATQFIVPFIKHRSRPVERFGDFPLRCAAPRRGFLARLECIHLAMADLLNDVFFIKEAFGIAEEIFRDGRIENGQQNLADELFFGRRIARKCTLDEREDIHGRCGGFGSAHEEGA